MFHPGRRLRLLGFLGALTLAPGRDAASAVAPVPAAAVRPAPAESPAKVVARLVADIRRANAAQAKLVSLCDGVGHRLSGSVGGERAVEWAVATMRADALENVRTEPVMVRRWVRGAESAELVSPRAVPLHMIGLGNSVGTPEEGITAEVVRVQDEKELGARAAEVQGKIVFFDHTMPPYDPKKGTGYGEAVRYRSRGPMWAGGAGAVAVLIRSVTARSLATPHTGATSYGDSRVRIPGAALSLEDADLLTRLLTSGQKVVVRLRMGARDAGEVPSANVVGELRGRELPDELVVIGGHLDSWDVGQGAQDDGAGVVMTLEALAAMKRLGIRPRRTLRVVLFANEENGLAGGQQYVADHRAELDRHVAALESDMGAFAVRGFGVKVADKAAQGRAMETLGRHARLLRTLGTLTIQGDRIGADVSPLVERGVPGMLLLVDESRYFDFHHSAADTVDKVDPRDLTETTAAVAAMAYLLAETPERLGAAPAARPGKPTPAARKPAPVR